MFYDLNVPYTPNDPETPRTVSFLAELGYTTLALATTLPTPLPSTLPLPPPTDPPPFPIPAKVNLLTRVTLIISDATQNHRLGALQSSASLLALRPTTEKALQSACLNLDCDLISLDLSKRLTYHFKHKTLAAAIGRGIRFEICYTPALLLEGSGSSSSSSDIDAVNARRNLISNATALIRTTRGRGIVISSEASRALGCRGPWDAVNLATVWGLGQERGKEAVCEEARKVVVRARMVRHTWRGVVDVKYGGETAEGNAVIERGRLQKGTRKETTKQNVINGSKRKADVEGMVDEEEPPIDALIEQPLSKREMKRRAKKARLEAALTGTGVGSSSSTLTSNKEKTGGTGP